uniref:sushi, von Willebrand factor type A, EGF and pentraxin domain-containing protein 1-like n=1 Tax=Styela clava TaxID=7725 RepID=UPI00193A2805|nr:sushi, von Willebrand factor type A, EGF and pentraxin domain-containing protein 1-like [Styela clava]
MSLLYKMRRFILLFVVILLILDSTSEARKRKRRRSLSRRPIQLGKSTVNILFVQTTSVKVGFSYVQGAKRYLVTAREWVDGKRAGNVASTTNVNDQARSATLQKLMPGREYILIVQGLGGFGEKIGEIAQTVVRMSQQCYVCNGEIDNKACRGMKNTIKCPHDKDACLNEVRYSKGVPKITKRCAQWRPELGKQIQNGRDITKACSGRENIKDVACKCMCRSNLCNEVEMPCLHECFKELPLPEYSYIKCSDGVNVGSKCRWICLPGYKVKGTRISECRNDRTWSVLAPPECVPDENYIRRTNNECPLLEPPENSMITCDNQNQPGSTCQFSCMENYFVQGSVTRTCDGATSKWTGEKPMCEEIRCAKIPDTGGLMKECTANETIGSICDLSCPIGRKFVGKSRLTCLSGGRWSAAIPRCTTPDCSVEPKPFPNVLMECGPIPSQKKGKVCQFSCEEGYTRSGAQNSYCYSGNSWTNNSPTCKRITCRPTMYAPPNGFVRCSDRSFYGSECVFSCADGYMRHGRESVVCGNRGKWSSMDLPVCKKIQCPKIQRFNGLYSCNNGQNLGSVCRFSCKRGFGFRQETVTKLKCVSKNLEEIETSKSDYTGKWDAPIPECFAIKCLPLGTAPEFSSVQCLGKPPYRAVGTSCTYRCKAGYNIVGSARTTCVGRSDGTSLGDWSSPPPFCQRVTCEILPELKFGTVGCTEDFYAGSKCTADCDYGRVVSGKKTVSCRVDGTWSSKLPFCKQITCESLPTLKNGLYNCGKFKRYTFNHECEAKCNTGFELSGPGAAVCGIAGNWLTSNELECTDKNECIELDKEGNPTNGGCEHYCVNTVGSYECQCDENYQLNSDGKTCRILICPTLEAVQKGRVACTNTNRIGSTCTLRCVPGFAVTDTRNVTCLKKGKWDKDMGTCTRISCPDISIPESGFMKCAQGFKFGSDCVFECIPGFRLEGKSSTRCGADGQWTSPVPTCTKKVCDPAFLSILNMIVECSDGNRFESMCIARCDEGYELDIKGQTKPVFVTKVHCLQDATWSSSKPKCIRKRCEPRFDELAWTRRNGTIACTDEDWLGSTCELSCDKGYKVKGPFRVTCGGDAVWNKKLGKCTKVQCPPLEAPSNGEIFCTEAASYQSKCSFYCNEGYQLVGEAETICLHDRSWTEKTPSCERIICEKSFMKLLKGTVACTDDTYFGSTCEYKCDPGYEFIDTETDIRKSFGAGLDEGISYDILKLSCLATGKWGNTKPACQKHKCIPPSAVLREAEPNGNILCSHGDEFESVCELACNKGYEVTDGRASTMCGDDRTWTPRLGTCQRIRCAMFEPLLNGAVQCSASNRYQSRCLFGCFPGYKLVGTPVSFCQYDRKWTKKAPRCEKIFCPMTHTKLIDGSATCTDGARYESECTYVCDAGYEMVFGGSVLEEKESVVLRCQFNAKWGGKLPVCQRKQCSLHDGALAKARLNGKVTCTESFWYKSECTVECNVGYKLIGSASTRCNEDADWEPAIGFCERRKCKVIKVPSHGSMECTNANKFESVCSFKCDYGYELFGMQETECLATETFSKPPPSCREIICPKNFLNVPNGKVSCTNDNKLASRCMYKCDVGYQLTTESVDVVECLETYTWDEEKPKCERKICPQGYATLIRAAEHGTLTCTNSNKYQSICSVTCYPGYKLTEGGAFTECRADQEWGPDLGYCTKIICEEFKPLENGRIECSDGLRFESVCLFSCDPGHEATHNKSSTCLADKKFSQKPPKCKKIACPSYHMRITNGKVHCTNGNTFGSVCKYECDDGFERVTGSASAQCLSDRTWDADKTGCERVQCDGSDILFVKAREHGTVTCTSSYFYQSVCSLKCDKGYELSGMTVGTVECNEFAQWDGELGYCSRIQCPAYKAPDNGDMSCTLGNEYESECVFTCHSGYEMIGNPKTTCLHNKLWTNKRPACVKVTCSTTNLFLDHGSANCTEGNKYLSVCWFKCDPGYEMDEDIPNAMCGASKAWTRNKPTCVKRECNFGEGMITRALQNGAIACTDGVRYESVCSLACDEGYKLTGGSGQIECTETATWDKRLGHCERITCKDLKPPQNSKMDCTNDNKYESICAFMCDDGYELEGESESTCLSNRKFSNPEPNCLKTKCTEDYLMLPFGSVMCTDLNFFKSVCKFECEKGYKMALKDQNVVKSECLSNQTWSLEIPICEKKTCAYDAPHLLKALEHGDIECTEANRYGSVCSLNCDVGYELTGRPKTECTEKAEWSNDIGYCKKIVCRGLDTPSSAIKSCTDDEFYNSTCTFACDGGYRFTEEDFVVEDEITLTCLATRTWTSPGGPPMCTREKCPDEFLTLENGNITCTDGSFYGSQCLFTCHDGYELVNPVDDFDVTSVIVSCDSDEKWDTNIQPECRRIVCDPNMQEKNEEMIHGEIKCTDGSNFESKCKITCHKGFQVVDGDKTTECLSSRTWAPLLGVCDKISCPPLEAPDDSTLLCTEGFVFKSRCQVICRPGFQIFDPENDYDDEVGLECKADGNWCGDAPTCARVKCPEENLSLEGGFAKCTNENLFESECKYKCDRGYQMTQGQIDTTQCTAHMTWTNPKPTCEKRRCPADDSSFKEAQENGEIGCSDENKFDSVCGLACVQGYELTGEPNATCMHTGDWSNGLGLCNRIYCNEVKAPANAVMKCTNNNRYESFCTFACKTGYMLTESSLKAGNGIVCEADKSWGGEVIHCEKITCPAAGFDTIENGKVTCNDSNYFTSRCLFECDGGYELAEQIDPNDPTTVLVNCTELGYWDVQTPPKCKKVKCEPSAELLQEALENGVVRCSERSDFKSVCKAKCNNGFELVGGESTTTCTSNMKWGQKLGKCEKISCGPLQKPKNSQMVCDDGFRFMSQCDIQCLPGYDSILSKKNKDGIATCRADGNWEGKPPICKKLACDSSYMKLRRGKVTCSERYLYNSECEYTCDSGFELVDSGSNFARCTENGTWSIPRPECKVKTCESAYAANGYMNCSGSAYNAVCKLSCGHGHILKGSDFSTCRDAKNGETKWTPPIGECEKVRCPLVPEIANGDAKCSDSNKYRSLCYVNCHRGFEVKGIYFSTRCLSDGTWSREFQQCERVTCDPSYLYVEYGSGTATDGNYYKSTVTYSCPKHGHKFTGRSGVTCLLNGKWTGQKPRCEKFTCPPINLPNGQVNCTGIRHNDYQSKCSYTCNTNYERIGSETTECQLDGTWTNSPPYCKGHCDIKFKTLEHGGVECTNSHYQHSRCRFWCDGQTDDIMTAKYSLFGNDFLTCTEDGHWDGMPPCCAQNCPPWGKMDLFFVFDSSSSVGWQNWKRLLDFANQILGNFHIGEDNVLAGAVRYNRDVDSKNELPIGKYKTRELLTNAIKFTHFGGWGTNTGKALNHVAEESLKKPGNRPDVADVVILFTDGVSQDDVKEASQKLKENNATVHVVGIEGSTGQLDLDQMKTIASEPPQKHIAIIRGGFDRLTAELSSKLGKQVCQNPCLLNQEYRMQSESYIRRHESKTDKVLKKSDLLI